MLRTVVTAISVTLVISAPVVYAAQFKGFISDAACGWNNARQTREAKECAQKCVKAGWAPVLVPDGQTNTHKIVNPQAALPFVGDHVIIEGSLDGQGLRIRSVRRTSRPGPTR